MRPACDFLLVLSLSGFWYQGYARLMSWEMFPLSLYSERVCMRWNYLILQWLYNLSAKPYKPGVFCEWRFLTTDSIYLKVIIQLRICLGIFFFFWLSFGELFSSVQSLSCVRLFVTPSSTPGLPVHHQLPEPTQTHVHHVSDAIQPSHPLSPTSSRALNLSQHQGLSSELALCIFKAATFKS